MFKYEAMAGGLMLFSLLLLGWHVFAYTRYRRLGILVVAFMGMFFVRGVAAAVNYRLAILPLQQDALHYHADAIIIARILGTLDPERLVRVLANEYIVEPAYTVWVGVLYLLFDPYPLVGFISNTFFFSLTSYNVYRLARACWDERSARVTAILFLLMPYSVLHSTYIYRDPVINYVLSEFFYQLLLLARDGPTPRRVVWFTILLAWTAVLRRENLVMAAGILGFLALRSLFVRLTLLTPVKMLAVFGVMAVAGIVIYANTHTWLLKNFQSLLVVEALNERAQNLTNARSAYLTDQQYNSYGDVVRYAPLRAVYFLFSPFPWDIFKSSQYVAFTEALLTIPMFLALPAALLSLWRRIPAFGWSAALYLIVGPLGAGLIQSNSAGAQRHRTQFTFLVVAIALPYLLALLRQPFPASSRAVRSPGIAEVATRA